MVIAMYIDINGHKGITTLAYACVMMNSSGYRSVYKYGWRYLRDYIMAYENTQQ